jgi:hypothetical protein
MPTQRTASCACGQLQVTVVGDPASVGLCNCTQCQKRTGSAFGVGAFFTRGQLVRVQGTEKSFGRGSDAGRSLDFRFCPECGSTVYWFAEFKPESFAVAVGSFADASFPKPRSASWIKHKLSWVTLPEGLPEFETQRA